MFLTALLTGFFIFLANALLLFIVYRAVNAQKTALINALRAYFETEEGQPSQFAQFIDIISERLAQKMVNTAKASFLGMQSVDKRNQDRMAQDMVTDVASQANPLVGLLLTSFPTLGRRLAKNPGLLELLLPMMSNLGKKSPGPSNGQSSPQAKFSL